jgi:hypothetical protein
MEKVIHVHLHRVRPVRPSAPKRARTHDCTCQKDRRAKDEAVKCWTCGERFPEGTTVYPLHQTASGKKCPMSGKKVETSDAKARAKDGPFAPAGMEWCSRCNGTGEVGGKECPRCQGSGLVEETGDSKWPRDKAAQDALDQENARELSGLAKHEWNKLSPAKRAEWIQKFAKHKGRTDAKPKDEATHPAMQTSSEVQKIVNEIKAYKPQIEAARGSERAKQLRRQQAALVSHLQEHFRTSLARSEWVAN